MRGSSTTVTVLTLFIMMATFDATESAFAQEETAISGTGRLETWTDLEGRSIRATLVGVNDDKVVLRRHDGQRGTVPMGQLSPRDRRLVVAMMQQARPASPANQRLNQVMQILNDPQVKQTEEKLIQENIRTETRTRTRMIRRYIEELYWQKYCHRRRIYFRLCRRIVPVMESIEESYQVQVPLLQAQTILDSPQDPQVGTGLSTIQLLTLPASAGGRASKIFSASQKHLPISVAETTNDVDRILVAESRVFTVRASDPTNEEKVKLVAKVRGSDRQVDIVVLIAVRDKASRIPSSATATLDQLAQELANRIAQDLR